MAKSTVFKTDSVFYKDLNMKTICNFSIFVRKN